jgi:2-oxoglutarate ferredoxin oxidoreductase subunit gamma
MKKENRHDVMIAGSGGRGILTIGRLLAEAGMSNYRYVTYFPNYGSAMRGGDSEVTVILSDSEISSQIVYNPEVILIMDASFYEPLVARVKSGGSSLVDSFVVSEKTERKDITIYYLPVTQKALEVGNMQVANLVMLGAYLQLTGAVPIDAIERAMDKRMIGTRREVLLSLNKQALEEGFKLIAGTKTSQ